MTNYHEVFSKLAQAWPEEAQVELDRVQIRNGGATFTDDDMETMCLRMEARHMGDLDQANRVQRAEAINMSELHPAFRQALESTGASAGDVADAAMRIYPNLSRQEAVARWMASAKKIDYADLRYGVATTNPLEQFARAIPPPQESGG